MPHTLKPKIRTVPHFPKQGVMFRDITTLLKDAEGFNHMVDLFVERYKDNKPDVVAGIESRGFIIGSALAHRLGLGFVAIRKPNKLPAEKEFVEYKTEYSTDKIEIHKDSIKPGTNVLIIDDLIATGGSALAACQLIEKLGGKVMECAVVIDLPDLKGSEKIQNSGYKVFKLIDFEGE
ncbi:adenine phosphoribosyltransferase [Candidatus Woesearchaeota archaeon]|nr:adenine phosphoribosyltransferase [Candidatus Woesearchaeota archaeon]